VLGVGTGVDSCRPKLAAQTCASALPKLAGKSARQSKYRLHVAAR
jgi:hypothetical protein